MFVDRPVWAGSTRILHYVCTSCRILPDTSSPTTVTPHTHHNYQSLRSLVVSKFGTPASVMCTWPLGDDVVVCVPDSSTEMPFCLCLNSVQDSVKPWILSTISIDNPEEQPWWYSYQRMLSCDSFQLCGGQAGEEERLSSCCTATVSL